MKKGTTVSHLRDANASLIRFGIPAKPPKSYRGLTKDGFKFIVGFSLWVG